MIPTEQQILDAANEAGLWPNTAHRWIPAFHRYHEVLNRMLAASTAAPAVKLPKPYDGVMQGIADQVDARNAALQQAIDRLKAQIQWLRHGTLKDAAPMMAVTDMEVMFAALSQAGPHPCAEAARCDLLDELEDMRIDLRDSGDQTTASMLGKAIDWINGEREEEAALAHAEPALRAALLETLETLCTGLAWNIENHPTVMNQSDEEALQNALAVVARARAAEARPLTHRHIARNTTYREVARGTLQSKMPLQDGDTLVAYVGQNDVWWFRPPAEFDDPARFERLGAGAARTQQDIERYARNLVDAAKAAGMVVTIEQHPLLPFAMGNYTPVITVWPARHSEASR